MKKHHWALVSLWVNLLQVLLKFLAGVLTGSLSMIGEAVHSLSDSFASAVAFVTIKLSDKKTQKFPYGLYRLENLGSVLIAFFLLLTAYEMVKRALTQQVVVREEYLSVGLAVVVFSLLSSLALSFFERRAGKRLNSPALMTDSYHTLTDALGSFLVLLSLLGVHMGYQLDRYFALGVALLICYTALNILWREVSVLLDVSADEKTLSRIREVLLSFPEVKEIKSLFVRSSGGRLFADLVLVLEGRDFVKMHHLVDCIEEALKKEVKELDMVFIHYEPTEGELFRVGVLLDEKGDVSRHFETARELLIFGKSPERLTIRHGDEKALPELIRSKGLLLVVCGHHPVSPCAKGILSKGGVFVWETEEKNPYRALKEVVHGLLEEQSQRSSGGSL
ncbi:MAG: cation diffusion facilitator family transporter [Aquificaceae bacterium]|nr:cation diffusion facilitator family transporter [Aquificaceae bacterium]MCX8060601.1 cation diffusion facilitator family transporter [Aquificaceae bacterium]MDW8097584.1 cation diffusion facilitator family transporter [Aquificaceae bacterium]